VEEGEENRGKGGKERRGDGGGERRRIISEVVGILLIMSPLKA